MNEWEWNLLEDKSPVASLTVGGVELQAGDAFVSSAAGRRRDGPGA